MSEITFLSPSVSQTVSMTLIEVVAKSPAFVSGSIDSEMALKMLSAMDFGDVKKFVEDMGYKVSIDG